MCLDNYVRKVFSPAAGFELRFRATDSLIWHQISPWVVQLAKDPILVSDPGSILTYQMGNSMHFKNLGW